MKKLIAYLLAVLCLTPALASCGETPAQTETTIETTAAETVPETEAETTSAETEEQTVTDAAPETEPEPADKIEDFSIGGVPLAEFSIVTTAEPSENIRNAATDLMLIVRQATGVTLPVVNSAEGVSHAIYVGKNAKDCEKLNEALTEVKDDGYAMVEDAGNLYISGVIGRGTMNGVYDFLQDHLGVRFYSDVFTFIKEEYVRSVKAGQKTVFNPVFPARYNWSRNSETNYMRITKRTKSTSIKYAGSHNLGSLSGTGDGFAPQPCLSDEKIFETVFENLCKQIDKKPTKTFFHVNPNDGGAYCACEKCKAAYEAAGGTAMGTLLPFINRIADAVKEKYPEREIDILTYAYKESTKAPDPAYVTPRDNVVITLCMMDSSCYTHSWNDPDCGMNRISYANMVAWSKICKKLCIYDYTYNHASYESSVGPNLDVLYDNIQTYKELGCVGMLGEGEHLNDTGEFCELRNYLINRLLWEPDVSREEYYKWWDEFMRDYYGDAAPYIREYIDLMNATSRRTGLTAWDGHTSVYTDPSVFYAPKVDGKKDYTVINKCEELWDNALACRLDDDQRAHVEKSSTHFRDFRSRYAETVKEKRDAAIEYKALCDKYTQNWDYKLAGAGALSDDLKTPTEGLVYREYADGTLYVSDAGSMTSGTLVIPAEADGKTVYAVGNSAFARAGAVVEAHISEGVRKIGTYAFRGAPHLKAVYLPESLETLGYGALGVSGDSDYGCPALKDVYYAGTAAEWNALYDRNNAEWKTLGGVTVHCSDTDIEYKAE